MALLHYPVNEGGSLDSLPPLSFSLSFIVFLSLSPSLTPTPSLFLGLSLPPEMWTAAGESFLKHLQRSLHVANGNSRHGARRHYPYKYSGTKTISPAFKQALESPPRAPDSMPPNRLKVTWL